MRARVDRRDEILKVAEELFTDQPYDHVLMDDVSEKVGVAKGTVYRYFETKEDLYGAYVLLNLDKINARIAVTSSITGSALERLRQTLSCLAEIFIDQHSFFQVVQQHECSLWARRKIEFAARRQQFRTILADLISQAEAEGIFKCPFEPAVAGDMIVGMIRNVLRVADFPPNPVRLADMALHVSISGFQSDGLKTRVDRESADSSNSSATF